MKCVVSKNIATHKSHLDNSYRDLRHRAIKPEHANIVISIVVTMQHANCNTNKASIFTSILVGHNHIEYHQRIMRLRRQQKRIERSAEKHHKKNWHETDWHHSCRMRQDDIPALLCCKYTT